MVSGIPLDGSDVYVKLSSLINGTWRHRSYIFTTAALSPPWQNADIGYIGIPGSAAESDGVYTIQASGNDIYGSIDSFHYVYQNITGDCEIIARVADMDNNHAWAKAGVMIRNDLNAQSVHAFMAITGGNGSAFIRRFEYGGYHVITHNDEVTAPYWVKVKRIGNVFSGYKSSDGVNWEQIGPSETFWMPSFSMMLPISSYS